MAHLNSVDSPISTFVYRLLVNSVTMRLCLTEEFAVDSMVKPMLAAAAVAVGVAAVAAAVAVDDDDDVMMAAAIAY